MTDGQSEWMESMDKARTRGGLQSWELLYGRSRQIPDESDQMEVPKRPDLRCVEHPACCECLRNAVLRVESLEALVHPMLEKLEEMEENQEAPTGWICTKCGQRVGVAFAVCYTCNTERPL